MRAFVSWLGRELREMLPAVVFLFIALQLASCVEELMVEGAQLTLTRFITVAVGSIVVAKCMLIAKSVPGVATQTSRPFVLRILWRTAVYGAVVLLYKAVEHAIPLIRHHGWSRGLEELLQVGGSPRFWGIAIMLLALIATYCAGEDAVRVIGARRALALFFGVGRAERPGQQGAGAPADGAGTDRGS